MAPRPGWILPLVFLLSSGSLGAWEVSNRCGGAPPCGYIYPQILLSFAGLSQAVNLPRSHPLEIVVGVTFTYDVLQDGISASDPTRPIVITFEFPRKPPWLSASVEPRELVVDISPLYLRPDASDPSNVQMRYLWTSNVTLRLEISGEPTLLPGSSFSKFHLFASSTESGLYKPAYAIKELRIVPEGASIVPPPPEPVGVVEAPPLEPFHLEAPLTSGVTIALDSKRPSDPWRPTALELSLSTRSSGRIAAALFDDLPTPLYTLPPRTWPEGRVTFNVTFPHPGEYTLAVVAEDESGRLLFAPSGTLFRLTVPPLESSWVRYPRLMRIEGRERIDRFEPTTTDPLLPSERWIPFIVYPNATGARVEVRLQGSLPVDVGRGMGNVVIFVLDPEGNPLASSSVDSANPYRTFNVGALPLPGTYFVRIKALSPPLDSHPTLLDLKLDVLYDDPPLLEDQRPGAPTLVSSGYVWRVGKEGKVESSTWKEVPVELEAEPLAGLPPPPPLRVRSFVLRSDGRTLYSPTPSEGKGVALGPEGSFSLLLLVEREEGAGPPPLDPPLLKGIFEVHGDPPPRTTIEASFSSTGKGWVALLPFEVARPKGGFVLDAQASSLQNVEMRIEDEEGKSVWKSSLSMGVPSTSLVPPLLPPGSYRLLVGQDGMGEARVSISFTPADRETIPLSSPPPTPQESPWGWGVLGILVPLVYLVLRGRIRRR